MPPRYAKRKKLLNMPLFVKGRIDYTFLILVFVLVGIGLVLLFSSSYATSYYDKGRSTFYVGRQLLFAGLGVVVLLGVSFFNYKHLRALALPLLGFSLLLLILVLFIGVTRNGATRWIDLGFTEFEPSEITKFAVICFYAHMIVHFGEKMKIFKYWFFLFVIPLGIIFLLMSRQPHYSGAIIIVAIGAAMMFLGGIPGKWVYIALGLFLIAIPLLPTLAKSVDYIAARLEVYNDPWSDARGKGWQTIQSYYALGSGGLLGLGLGNSRQKFFYLPEESNDYIFAIGCEELGFVGGVVILVVFALLIIRGYWLALHIKDRFGSLLVAGIITQIALQVFLNIAVVTNLIPVTGISLPFFSYGGTALIIQMAEMGVILAVTRQSENTQLDGR